MTKILKYIFLSILIIVVNNIVLSQNMQISIFSTYSISKFILTTESSDYEMVGDNVILAIKQKELFQFEIKGNKVKISNSKGLIGEFSEVKIMGFSENNIFNIKPEKPSLRRRSYNDNLIVKVENKKLLIINDVNLENYIAGVVESEGGAKAHNEYYKTQAILCRTYALVNFDRHILERANLCDGVHCQAYYGRSQKNDEIMKAVKATKGLVLVDSTLHLITATFHSNSGGETANSEDVWLRPRPYLKSTIDTFSLLGNNATWTKTIPIWKWRKFLLSKKFHLAYKGYSHKDLEITQIQRKKYYRIRNDSILTTKIRAYWKLKSSFFSIRKKGNNLILSGKGYGHGVGLSQEGAMEMANLNYSYRDICKLYFKNTHIVSLVALAFFREVFDLDNVDTTNNPPPAPNIGNSIEDNIHKIPGID